MNFSSFFGNYRYGPTSCLYSYNGLWWQIEDEIHWEVTVSREGMYRRPGNGQFTLPDAESPLDEVAKAVAVFIDSVHLDS